MKKSIALLFISLIFVVVLAACGGEDAEKRGITVSNAHIYLPAAGADGTSASDVAAAFMLIENFSETDDRLIGARADFSMAQVHEMVMEGDVMKMREVEGIDLPAEGSLELKSGGYHVMLMGLNGNIKVGDEKTVTLIFEKAGEMPVPMLVTAEQ